MPGKVKAYIIFHILVTISIFVTILTEANDFSFKLVIPFVIFGLLFEFLRLSAFAVGDQELNISSGAAIVLAAIILFNPLELTVFALCYGVIIIMFPLIKDVYKAAFNICQTINVTYASFLVWHVMKESDMLLSYNNLVALFVTMFVFIFLDLMTINIVISLSSGAPMKEVIKESFNWVLVSYILIAFIGLILAVMYKYFFIYGLIGFSAPLLLMRYNMFLFVQEKNRQMQQLIQFNETLKENNEQLLLTLSQVIDARDNSLFGHSASVAKYAIGIGKLLNLTAEQLDDLYKGALIHDIGKLGISEAILHKPGRLTDEEFEVVKKHTLIGEKIIARVKGMERVALIIGQHHEHYSGKGYPRQLAGDDILIESRIVTLCDSLDTMLSTRSYKEGWTLEDAKIEVLRCRGQHFDPQVVDAFLQLVEQEGTEFFQNSAKSKNNSSIMEKLLAKNTKLKELNSEAQ